jgi:hypothetical protein
VFNRTIGLRDTFAKEVGGKVVESTSKQYSGASVADSINAAEEHLAIARLGLKDMDQSTRARSGLYNAVVFGRAVTFALQNMKNQVDGFDEWYAVIQAELKSDELMRFFHNLRTEIEKTAKRQTGGYVNIAAFTQEQLVQLPRPPGAEAFFMGDATGGSGWKIKMPDGTTEKYYVDLPSSWQVQTGLVLPNAPLQYQTTDARKLVGMYLDKMATIVQRAKSKFLSSSTS